MGVFGIVFFFVFLMFIGAGIVIGAVVTVIAFALVSLGVVSSSVIVGIRKRSAGAGIRTFLLLCGVLGGIPCGMFCAWLASNFAEIVGDDAKIFIYGGLSGAIGGLIIAVMFDYILRNSARWLAGRFKIPSAAKEELHG